jgi:hypothetical protein
MLRFPVLRRIVPLLSLVTFLGLGPLATQVYAQECEFLTDDGDTRPCTFTEKYGQCLYWAYESYYDCVEDSGSFIERAACELGVQVDILACTLGMFGEAVDLVTPV